MVRKSRNKTTSRVIRNNSTGSPPNNSSLESYPHDLVIQSLRILAVALDESILVVDSAGRIRSVWIAKNKEQARDTSHLVGEPLTALIGPQPFVPLSRVFQHLLRTGGMERTEYQVDISSPPRWFASRIVPLANRTLCRKSIAVCLRDITAERRRKGERLQRSETILAQAEELAHFGSVEYDCRSGKAILSKELLRMYGLRSAEEWSRELFWNSVLLDDRDSVRSAYEQSVADSRPFSFVTQYRLPNGLLRTYDIRTLPIAGDDGEAERILGVVHDITEETRIEADMRRLSQELIRTQDTERRQLARDLHESAGQTLAALKMTLANLEEALPEDAREPREHLKSARGLAEDAVREVRVVSYLMYPPLLDDAGLSPALHWYVRGFSERSGIDAKLKIQPDFGRHSQEVETTIFRIVQEALTNVHRHSGSPNVTIRLTRDISRVIAEIRDCGSGIPMSDPGASKIGRLGVGIAGMRERVEQLNGVFEIESVPGQGTTVRTIFPLKDERRPSVHENSESLRLKQKGE
jgi:signal transduction histidine kinase